MDYKAEGLELLALMRHGTHMKFQVNVRKAVFTFRPLSQVEEVLCITETNEEFQAKKESEKTDKTYYTILAIKKLVLASSSDVGMKDSTLTEYILGRLTNDEITFLFKEYTRGVEKYNPALETMSADDLRELSDQVKKNSSLVTELSSLQLHSLVLYLLETKEE